MGTRFEVVLVRLVLRADAVGGLTHPLHERLARVDRHLVPLREVEPLVVVRVEVLADQVHVVQDVEEQAARPVRGRERIGDDLAAQAQRLLGLRHGVGHGPARDERDRWIDAPHGLREEPVLDHELRERPHAELPLAPGLVADAPVLDAVGLGMAVLRAQAAHPRGRRAVRVLDVLRRRPGVAEAGVDGDVRLHAEQTAQRHELVRADVVGLDRVPGGIEHGRAPVAVADGLAPIVGGHEVAAGKR